MRIEFGMSLDGAAWADGVVRCGPQALLRLLQERLALTRPQVEPAVRIARYATAVAAADHPWCRESFARDPWATASTLLGWRDAAVTAGAHLSPAAEPAADADLPERIDALATIEQHLRPEVAGHADDLREIVEHLETQSGWPLGIEELMLHEDPSQLPGLWSQLLTALAAQRIPTRALDRPVGQRPELIILEAEDEWSAAETAARFLSGRTGQQTTGHQTTGQHRTGPDATAGTPSQDGADADGSDRMLQILATADTVILDQELHRRALPALGVVSPSADRAALQILPLFLAITTAPVDVQQVAAFLDLRVMDAPEGHEDHVGLVPARARTHLQNALAQEPGIGGAAWRSAVAHLQADESISDGARAFLRAVCDLVAAPLPADAITPERLRTVLAPLGARLRALGQGTGEPLRAVTHLQSVLAVLDALDPGHLLSARELSQIITTAGGRITSPVARAEASSAWRVHRQPAHLLPLRGDVLWWGADRESESTAFAWDAAEREALEALGARIPTPAETAALTTDAGLRGLHGAQRLIVVRTRRRAENPTAAHPLLAHLATAHARAGEGVDDVLRRHTMAVADTLHSEGATIAGTSVTVTIPERHQPAPQPEDLTKHTGAAPHLTPQRLSYSQAEDLLGCRQKWTYRNALRIRPAAAATVPTGNQMVGTLVHAVVESLVKTAAAEGRLGVPSPDRIRQEILALVPRLASELELPGREMDLAAMCERAVRSLTAFFDRLAEAGITITAVESGFEQPVTLHLQRGDTDVPFTGFRDVLGEAADGRPVVIDLKWTYAATKYPDLYETGEALQLASYAWSLQDSRTDVAYFLLAQGEFVAANPALDPRGRPTLDVGGLWERGRQGITEALDAILDGEVSARSGQILLDAGQDLSTARSDAKKTYARAREIARDQGDLVVDARCDYCDYSLLCGLRGDRS